MSGKVDLQGLPWLRSRGVCAFLALPGALISLVMALVVVPSIMPDIQRCPGDYKSQVPYVSEDKVIDVR